MRISVNGNPHRILLIDTEDEMGGTRGMNEREENMFTFFVSKLEGKRQLGSSRCRWENYIQMYLKNSIGVCGVVAPYLRS